MVGPATAVSDVDVVEATLEQDLIIECFGIVRDFVSCGLFHTSSKGRFDWF